MDAVKASIAIKDLYLETDTDFQLQIEALSISRGEIVALIGPNGSGKTTLLETLMGLRRFKSGDISIFGNSIATIQRDPVSRRSIGCQLQRNSYASLFKVSEIVALHRALYGKREGSVATGLGVEELRSHKYTRMSGGQKQRVDLYVAMGHAPELLLLDEPTTGLDRRSADAFFRLIADWKANPSAAGRTAVIASHKPEEVALADRIVLMNEGKVTDILTMPCDLERVVGRRRYDLGFVEESAAIAAEQELRILDGVVTVLRDGKLLKAFAICEISPEFVGRHREHLSSYAFAESSVDDIFAVANLGSR